MMSKLFWKLECLAVLLLFLSVQQAHGKTPLETVEKQVNAALGVLTDPALKGDANKEMKEDKLWAIADDMFDYPGLSKRTLGKGWKKLNAQQQKEFTDLFSKHLGNIYLDRIMAYSDEKVTFNREKKKGEKALVYTKVVTKTKEIPIDYRVVLKNGDWRVYDVVIEGVSLVKNYRSQFREMLKKKDPEHLLETLRKKVKEKD
jgi:phospholipid transport system substrate-binding protein